MKVMAAAVAMMLGSSAAMAAGQVILCDGGTGISTIVQNGATNPGFAPANGCSNDGRDFAQISDVNGTSPDYMKVGSGTVEIMANDRISMLTRVDMNGQGIINLADGAVSSASKEGINGSQLYSLASSTANALGGGAAVSSNGAWSSPTYNIGGQQFHNVGDALSNLDSRIAQSSGGGLVQQDAATRNITVAKNTDGTIVDVTGTQGARQVTGVGAGALSASSTDAVNGSQLYQTNVEVDALNQRVQNISIGGSSIVASQANDSPASATGANATAIGNGAQATAANSVALGDRSVASEDNTVSVGSAGNERRVTNVAAGVRGTDAANMNQLNALQSNVNAVAREAFAGVAAAMAMPNLTPNQPGNTVVAAGVANYKGYTWLVNAAASFTPHGDTGVRGQVGYEF